MDGDFVVKITEKNVNQISTDLALGHVNKVGKVTGGLIGITRSDSARGKWCLTYNERSRLVDETSVMFRSPIDDAEYAPSANTDVGRSRIGRDREDVQKLIDQLERFSVFSTPGQDLICFATRDVAPDHIRTVLLSDEANGNSKLADCVEARLCKREVDFHAKLKQSKSVSLKSMYTVESKEPAQKSKIAQADKVLFQRLLVAKDAGCDIDLRNVLCHELSPVPLAIADTAGYVRPTNKAALAKILEEAVTVAALPAAVT
jgi:hypothetical protein